MPGELDVSVLLRNLQLVLSDAIFVFVTVSSDKSNPIDMSMVQMLFREKEGITLIVEKSIADRFRLSYTFPSRMITCDVHSSLEAVGFMAVIADVLAKNGIGCNPVSGFYHDHLFVPVGRAEDAAKVLEKAARDASDHNPEI